MFKLFGFGKDKAEKDAKKDVATRQTAPGTSIGYDAKLIPSMKADHQQLLTIFGHVQSALANRKYSLASEKLGDFKATLQGHLLTENVRFYVYLTRHFAEDSVNAQLISEFRREMDGIARVVMGFLRKYNELVLDDKNAEEFKRELGDIGTALVKRIQREEEILYPLYQPSY